MEKTNLVIAIAEDEFMSADRIGNIEAKIENYNNMQSTATYESLNYDVRTLAYSCCGKIGLNEFARAMAVLELARAGRLADRIWIASADIAFENDDLELCREFVTREIKEASKGDVANSNKAYIPLSRESADENVMDIIGMITDELGELTEDDYEELLTELAAPLNQWRALKVPKWEDKEAYDIVYAILESCYEHKALHTALRLLGLLYVADDRKKMPNLVKTNILAGKIMYDLGYMEVARRCFLFAARDNARKRRPPFPEEYREFLKQDTKIEITNEIREKKKFIEDAIASGKYKTYTREEVEKYENGELEIEFPDIEKQEAKRNKLGEKALKTYEKYAGGSPAERLKGIEEALSAFTEPQELYEQAAYLNFLKANIYLEGNDIENAYAAIRQAYKCKGGNRNGMVLLGMAVILSKMGKAGEAAVYVFRSYILCGRDFVVSKLGENAMETIEEYLS
ncbi:MAG: hypothetical protein NC223_11850 [Butyrivibrio sp.]|nr:hypothetical protein [Butyrivibrio sp.]